MEYCREVNSRIGHTPARYWDREHEIMKSFVCCVFARGFRICDFFNGTNRCYLSFPVLRCMLRFVE